jgi:hypothetical protein
MAYGFFLVINRHMGLLVGVYAEASCIMVAVKVEAFFSFFRVSMVFTGKKVRLSPALV